MWWAKCKHEHKHYVLCYSSRHDHLIEAGISCGLNKLNHSSYHFLLVYKHEVAASNQNKEWSWLNKTSTNSKYLSRKSIATQSHVPVKNELLAYFSIHDLYVYRCDLGYNGDTCEDIIDNCKSAPCQNGATCQNQVNNYTCVCPPGQCHTLVTHLLYRMFITKLILWRGMMILKGMRKKYKYT